MPFLTSMVVKLPRSLEASRMTRSSGPAKSKTSRSAGSSVKLDKSKRNARISTASPSPRLPASGSATEMTRLSAPPLKSPSITKFCASGALTVKASPASVAKFVRSMRSSVEFTPTSIFSNSFDGFADASSPAREKIARPSSSKRTATGPSAVPPKRTVSRPRASLRNSETTKTGPPPPPLSRIAEIASATASSNS